MFGKNLRRARELRGWTQADLASKSGYSRSSIINWETGKRAPRTADLERLAEVLELSLDYFLTKEISLQTLSDMESQEDVSMQKQTSSYAWWGEALDRAHDVADRGDAKEIALIEPLLRAALEALEIAKAQAETDCRPRRSEKPRDDGVVKSA